MSGYVSPKEAKEIADQILPELLAAYGGDIDKLREDIASSLGPSWPKEYKNRDTGKIYKPHNEGEERFVYSDTPTYPAILGGEGSGKSVASIIKTLERVRRGMEGVLAAPNLPHLKRSLWPEFQRWCPWDQVIEKHKQRGDPAWEPYQPFWIVFNNGARLQCGGLDDPIRWRGPNINFVYIDEAAVKKDAGALKVLSGRVRIPGPNGEPPQFWIATTPEMNWLYDYYGPLMCECVDCLEDQVEIAIQKGEPMVCPNCNSPNLHIVDPLSTFKHQSYVVVLKTTDNRENLSDGFLTSRRSTLTELEASVLIDAEWAEILEGQPFLPTMLWWDECKEPLPPLDKETPLVIAIDGAKGRSDSDSDCFGLLAVSRHPDPSRRHNTVAIRYVKSWQVRPGQKLDYLGRDPRNPGPERELLRLCGWEVDEEGRMKKVGGGYNVKCVVADPTELHDLITRFKRERVVWIREFGQMAERIRADNDFLRLIQEKRVAHSNEDILRRHVKNADRKLDAESKKLRIVKRQDSLKIDLAICASMAAYECLRLSL